MYIASAKSLIIRDEDNGGEIIGAILNKDAWEDEETRLLADNTVYELIDCNHQHWQKLIEVGALPTSKGIVYH